MGILQSVKYHASTELIVYGAIACIILFCLYVISTANYLLFHGLVELASIVVAFAIFVIVWNTRRTITNTFFLVIGISFLFTGSIDLVHMLAYKGMGVFPGNSSDLPTQLWIAARYFQSIAFLIATLLIGKSITKDRKYDAGIIFAVCTAAFCILMASIFWWQNFPNCFIDGTGLTPFKIASEYVISAILILAIIILALKRSDFDPIVWKYLVAAQVFLIVGELAFTSYASVYGFMNMIGHLAKLVSVYFFYRAIVVIAITHPVDLLFSELKQKSMALQQSEARYAITLDAVNDGLWDWNVPSGNVYFSPHYYTMLGYQNGEFPATYEAWRQLIHPEDHAPVETQLQHHVKTDTSFAIDLRMKTASGDWLWVTTRGMVVERDAAGAVVRIVGTLSDITERKRADDEIKRIKMAVDATSDAIGMSTVDGHHFYQNAAFDRMFGYTTEEVSRLQPAQLYADRDVAREVFGTIMAGTSWQGKIEMIAKNGRQFPVSLRADAIKNEKENIIGLIGVHTDITERKKAEEALRESEEKFHTVADFTYDWELWLGPDKQIVYCSPSCERITGYLPEEFIADPQLLEKIVHPDDLILKEEHNRTSGETHEPQSVDFRIIHYDGSVRWIGHTCHPVTAHDGTTFGRRVSNRDITERKRAEEAVQAAVKLNQLIDTMSVSESMGYTLDEAERLTTSKNGFFHLVNPDEQTIQLITWSTETRKHCFIPKDPERNYPVKKAGVWVDCLRERKPVIHNDYPSLPHKKGLPECHVPITRELVVPIFDEDKIVAIIGVGNKATDYAEQDINVLTLLAKNAWTLIQRKLAEEERERIRSWLAGVNRILESVLSPAPLDQKLKIITDGVVETFVADFCRIWLIDKGDLCNTDCMHAEVAEGPHICRFRDMCLHLKASSGRYTHIDGKGHRRVPFGAYKIGRIASGEETRFLTNDVEHDPRVHDHEWAKSLGLVAFAGYRLKPPDGEVLGVFALFARFPISPYMDAMLEGLSRAISLAIQKDIADKALHESEELYRVLFEESPISLWEEDFSDIKVWIDTKTNENIGNFRTWLESHPGDVAGCAIMVKVTHINRATMALFGAASQKEFSEELSTIFTADSYDAFREEIIALAGQKNGFEGEFQIQTLNGERKIVLMKVTVVPGYEQTFSKILVSIIDISDLKRVEGALRQANRQLNILSSITRHDILNQLLALKGYLELSPEFIDNPEKLSEFIKKEQQIANTIDRQITFTRDYQELGVAAPAWQNVNANIKSAIMDLPMRAVHVDVDRTDLEIFADRLFLKVFYNLFDNALKYGGDQMTTIQISSQESETHLVIVCEDNGVGITDEDKKHLFTRGFGKHTGLGLFLSREILGVTGITIIENSVPGTGARFEITVPKGEYRFNGPKGK